MLSINQELVDSTVFFNPNEIKILSAVKGNKKMEDRKTTEEKLYKHLSMIKLPIFIHEEIAEQINFLTQQKMIEMTKWCKQEFCEWYDSLI